MTKQQFDLDNIVQAIKNGEALAGKGGVLTPFIKQLSEAAMASLT